VPGNPEPPIGDSPLIECDLPLGRPGLIAHNDLLLSGWAASPKGISGVAVQIEDRQWNASFGLDTPALGDRLRDFPGAGRAGYRLQVDTSSWTPGPHYVTVAAFDSEGGRSAVEGQVEIRPFDDPGGDGPSGLALGEEEVAICLDPPLDADGVCEIAGPLRVSGWAHAKEGVEAVVVTLDGSLQHEALGPVVRPDLLGSLGREIADGAGFALQLDPVDCPPGPHTLTVVALSRDGRTAGLERELACRAPGPAAGADWAPDESSTRLPAGDRDAAEAARVWESRALLAESDAALSRAEANLARRAQEATLRALRDAEARSLARGGRSGARGRAVAPD
jgi:hypothetical protein